MDDPSFTSPKLLKVVSAYFRDFNHPKQKKGLLP
jgi:hypothetical protein